MHGDVAFDFTIIVVEKKEKGKILPLTIEHAMGIFLFDFDHRRSVKERTAIEFHRDVAVRQHFPIGLFSFFINKRKKIENVKMIFFGPYDSRTLLRFFVALASRNSRHICACADDDEGAMDICSKNTC